MKRSAASSSWAVVTPGWHLERSMRTHRAWIAPAFAIASICSGVLRMITESRLEGLELFLHAQRGQHRPDPVADLVRGGKPVDPPQDRALLVVADERLGLLVVGAQTAPDHGGLVVVADLEPGAVDVADALVLRRVELHMEEVALLDAHAPAAEPPDDLLVGDLDQDHGGEPAAEIRELRVERLALSDRAGEAVEDEPVRSFIARHPLGDQADHDLVRHQVAAIHVLRGLLAQVAPVT